MGRPANSIEGQSRFERGAASAGLVNGLIGVAIFAGSLPATRLAVQGFEPLFLTAARATIAGLLAVVLLLAGRERMAARGDLVPLAIVSLGVVVGFPLLTAMALTHMISARSIVYIGLLPLATAAFGLLRGGERPRPAFWLFSALGSAVVVGFALAQGTGSVGRGDLMMVAAVLVCGLGYAEGARLSRRLGGWQVICWALVVSLPLMAPLAWLLRPAGFAGIDSSAWAGLAYVSLFSMLIGFVFWYRGLAQGGTASVGQLQLLQPFLGLGIAALVLGEAVTPGMVAAALAVIACVYLARRTAR